MNRYRKKPVVIDAIQFTGAESYKQMCEVWAQKDFVGHSGYFEPANDLKIFTLEGTHQANIGDWIIKGVKGQYYPCKPDIFEATYERA
jgi:hypothetical protein